MLHSRNDSSSRTKFIPTKRIPINCKTIFNFRKRSQFQCSRSIKKCLIFHINHCQVIFFRNKFNICLIFSRIPFFSNLQKLFIQYGMSICNNSISIYNKSCRCRIKILPILPRRSIIKHLMRSINFNKRLLYRTVISKNKST